MLTMLTKVQSRRSLVQEISRIFAHVCFRNEVNGSWLTGNRRHLAAHRKTTGIRNVTTSCALCAKLRGNPQKKEQSEKKTGQHVRGMDNESEKWARVLWDYLCLHQSLEKSDVIIGLGCHDVRVAERSADLFLEGFAPWLLFTGYLGNQTAGVWTRPEADVFLDVALRMGVPRGNILLETEATNTGENIRFSYRLLKENNIPARRVILVQQPFMERRVFATFLRQWHDQGEHTHAIVTSPQMGISAYPHPTVGTATDLITYMLGVLERIRDYPQKGFQVEQEITPSALSAYQWLLYAGYIPK